MNTEYAGEVWKPYTGHDWSDANHYLISNYGRVKRRKKQSNEWKFAKTSLVRGYESFWISKKNKKSTTCCYVHRIVAILFLEKQDDQRFVIHVDFNKRNNKVKNLKWVNTSALNEHHKLNPKKLNRKGKITYSKLTEGRVRMIKKKIFDPNRKTRMRIIAKQFGISEMQLYRIKSGENWGHVKI